MAEHRIVIRHASACRQWKFDRQPNRPRPLSSFQGSSVEIELVSKMLQNSRNLKPDCDVIYISTREIMMSKLMALRKWNRSKPWLWFVRSNVKNLTVFAIPPLWLNGETSYLARVCRSTRGLRSSNYSQIVLVLVLSSNFWIMFYCRFMQLSHWYGMSLNILPFLSLMRGASSDWIVPEQCLLSPEVLFLYSTAHQAGILDELPRAKHVCFVYEWPDTRSIHSLLMLIDIVMNRKMVLNDVMKPISK